MLTGQRAFGNASTLIALTSVIRDTPPFPSEINPAVSRELGDLVMRCLAKRADDRPASAGDVRRALLSLPHMEEPKDSGILDACAEGHRALRSLSSASLAKARACFEHAVRSGSDDPEVWSGMSEYYAQISLLGMGEPAEVLPKAIWAAKKAMERDARAQTPRVVLALLRANHEYRWTEVGQTLEGAAPNSRALWFLRPMGRFDEAEALVRDDPAAVAWLSLERGDLTKAVRAASAADLDSWLACWVQAWALIASGRVRQAIETCEGALRLEPGNSWIESALATALAMNRQREAARRIIGQPHWKPASFPVTTLIALGETDAAFGKARGALQRRDPRLITVLRLPTLQPYRTDARYRELIEGLNLAA
jgi:Flp pilus assembly protein TadD